VLVLKGLLRGADLNNVAVGGLSSFSLANMVVASLQDDDKVPSRLT